MPKLKNKNILFTIIGFIVILFLIVLFGKLVVYDCIIGTKIYDENEIVIRYYRFVNILTVKNNSDGNIYMLCGVKLKRTSINKGSF